MGLVQGDVEIHRRQQDWYSHGHSNDPHYNGVVLHAALDLAPSPTNLHSGGEAPVVSLKPLLADQDVSARSSAEPIWNVLEPLGFPRPQSASNGFRETTGASPPQSSPIEGRGSQQSKHD